MHAAQVLKCLQKHGQLLDSEIAEATGISLPQVQKSLPELLSRKEISQCTVTQFKDGIQINGVLCRISGYIPPAAPGRKSKANQ